MSFDPYAVDDPHAAWAELRDTCPVAHSERMGGFWLLSRYDDVVEVARDAARFNNSGGPQFGTPRPPLEVDRPEHSFFRRLLQPYFAKEHVDQLAPRVREYVVEMLEPLLAAGGGEFAEAVSYPLPARTLCLWLGLPDSEWAPLKRISEELFAAEEGRGDDPATRARCNDELYDWSRRIVDEGSSELVAGMLAAGVDERTSVEVVRLLLTAGHNSTTGAIGNSVLTIARDAGVQQRLRDNLHLIPSAIEEFLRLETPVQAMPRWPNEDVELHGRTVPAGEQLMLFWAAANRDPEHFPEPERCVLDRAPNDHLTFGRGIHKCIGADLARVELRVTIEELLARTEWVELAGDPVRTTFIRQGVSRLPLAFR
jgi:cytochrome P450